MRKILNPLLLGLIFVAGCATTGDEKPHVLSGQAPVEDVIAKGDESFRNQDFQAAAILYQIAVNQAPQAEYWFKLGNAQNYLGNQVLAMHAFYQAAELDPDHRGALEKLGLYYTAKGDVGRARGFLERLIEVDPDNWKGYNSLGVLADLEEDFDAARGYYLSALKIRPDLAILWNNLGYSVYLLGQLEPAAEYLHRALELDPGHQAARQNLALVYARQDRYEEALATFLETEDVSTAYTKVGYLAYKVGDYQSATDFLEEAIRLSPTYNKLAHNYLAAAREARKAAG